jgi:hypothetical protein
MIAEVRSAYRPPEVAHGTSYLRYIQVNMQELIMQRVVTAYHAAGHNAGKYHTGALHATTHQP